MKISGMSSAAAGGVIVLSKENITRYCSSRWWYADAHKAWTAYHQSYVSSSDQLALSTLTTEVVAPVVVVTLMMILLLPAIGANPSPWKQTEPAGQPLAARIARRPSTEAVPEEVAATATLDVA